MNLSKSFDLFIQRIEMWIDKTIAFLPDLILALIIFFVGLYISKFIKNFTKKKIQRYFPKNNIASIAINAIYIFAICLVTFFTLKVLRLESTITTMLASAGIAGLAIAFAFQNIVSNYISGIFLSFHSPFVLGDTIEVKDYVGTVESIQLRDTTILTFEGQYITLPNKDVFESPIINYSSYGKRRVDIKGGVSYADDLGKARDIALESLNNIKGVESQKTTFLYDGLGDSSINFTVRIWIDFSQGGDYLLVLNDAIIKMKGSFDENNISIPFPIRTIDFGIKGGENLSQMLSKANKSSEN